MKLPPQSIAVYRLVRLAGEGGLTAKEIADSLSIFPNAVYRSVRPLLGYGLMLIEPGYPEKFGVVKEPGTLESVAAQMRDELLGVLKVPDTKLGVRNVRDQDELLRSTTREVRKATHSIDFMVSGLEVPAETILAYKQAAGRGVRIRALVYQPRETTSEMFHNWQAIGVEVRHCLPHLAARLFVIDKRVCFFTSYDPVSRWEAVGQQITSLVLGELLDGLFEEKWARSRGISRI